MRLEYWSLTLGARAHAPGVIVVILSGDLSICRSLDRWIGRSVDWSICGLVDL